MNHSFYSPSHIGSRHCCRCDLPLTDAASLDEGIGPICRKLDNALLARAIQSDLPKALEAYKQVDILSIVAETQATYLELEAALTAPDAAQREDWRKEVKRVEWILSHGQTQQNQKALKSLVLALGYVGIVSLWNGEAATGLATIAFVPETGLLIVSGPQNKAARIHFKKIHGWNFTQPKTGDDKPFWSFPAKQFAEVKAAVWSHYPNNQGLAEALKAAQSFAEEQAKKAAEEAAKKAAEQAKITQMAQQAIAEAPAGKLVGISDKVTLEEVGDLLKVKTPYHVVFIASLKAQVPYGFRNWNPSEKVWEVSTTYRKAVEGMLTKFFPAQ